MWCRRGEKSAERRERGVRKGELVLVCAGTGEETVVLVFGDGEVVGLVEAGDEVGLMNGSMMAVGEPVVEKEEAAVSVVG